MMEEDITFDDMVELAAKEIFEALSPEMKTLLKTLTERK